VRNLDLIGEAATQVPPAVRDAHPAVPRRQVVATRDRPIHGYLGIDPDTLRSIIATDVRALLSALKHVKARIHLAS